MFQNINNTLGSVAETNVPCLEHVCRIPLRMSEEDMLIGDDAIHGEDAYCFDYDVAGPDPPGSHVIEGKHEHVARNGDAEAEAGSGYDGKKIAKD